MTNRRNITGISAIIILMLLGMNYKAYSQRVGFIASDQIRELFPEAKQSDQRIQTITDEWKRERKEYDQQIEAKEFEINKNRLIWTDAEKLDAENVLSQLKSIRAEYVKLKYAVGGEYEQICKAIKKPVEEKIFAAVQKVAATEGYDMVWDKSIQPLSYVNFKYDLTLKVLKELGVDVEALEKEQQEKINKDPRNSEKNRSKTTPTKKTRKRRTEIEKTTTDEAPKVEKTESSAEPTTTPKNKESKTEIEEKK